MGIKHFWIYLSNNYSDVITTISKKDMMDASNIDALAVDMNGVIHQAAQQVFKYGSFAPKLYNKRFLKSSASFNSQKINFFKKVGEILDHLVLQTRPNKQVILCIDGVAGASKMNQQRQRRYKAGKINKGLVFDPNSISPGTLMFDHLSKYLDFFIFSQLNYNPFWTNLEVIFSNEKVAGEGEHKIYKFLRENKNIYSNYTVCIHGMDADLIMLSLASPIDKILIYREDSRDFNKVHLVDIQLLRKCVCKFFKDTTTKSTEIFSFSHDFVLMCYIVGNDFLPPVPGVEILLGGIDAMMDAYKDTLTEFNKTLVRKYNGKYRINRKPFIHFFKILSSMEKELLDGKIKKIKSFFTDTLLESAMVYNNKGEFTINIDKYKDKYYAKHFPGTDIDIICMEYIKGIEWVLEYYTTGIPSWEWKFPWEYSPFLSDIYTYLKEDKYKPFKFNLGIPLSPFEQLMCIIPPVSSHLLPKPLDKIYSDDSELKEFFPKEFTVDLSGKRREWEGVVLLPAVDIKRFRKIYQEMKPLVHIRDMKRNIQGKTYIYKRNKAQWFYKSYYGNIEDNMFSKNEMK